MREICDRFDERLLVAAWTAPIPFPFEFSKAIAEGGWLGIAMPVEYGGAGLGVTEASIMMQVVGASAGFFAACSTIHINIFGLHSIVKHGSEAQKKEWLPKVISGEIRACFGVTEPDAGLDTTKITTRAVRKGDRYVVHGQKIWTSTAQQAQKGGAAGTHHPYRGMREADRRPDAVLRRPRPEGGEDHGNPQDGPPCGQFQPGVL